MTIDDRHQDDRFTRREFLVTALAVGFAVAVRPTDAGAVITTDTEGLVAGEVKIPVARATKPGEVKMPAALGAMPAYRAMPEKGKAHATILVVEEIFGVHEYIKDVCRRLAKEGYLAIAPELFARQGDPTKLSDPQQIITDIVAKTPDSRVMADLDATVDWAEKNGGDIGRLGITGFCWGGRIVWLYTAHSRRLKAGVAWYGRVDGTRTTLQPQFPFDVIPVLKAPVLGLYGGADESIRATQLKRMKAGLTAIRSRSEIVVYPDAPHGFHADYRPSYRENDARDGWTRMLKWFADHRVPR
jgi:carboxymethylenebutenolidase